MHPGISPRVETSGHTSCLQNGLAVCPAENHLICLHPDFPLYQPGRLLWRLNDNGIQGLERVVVREKGLQSKTIGSSVGRAWLSPTRVPPPGECHVWAGLSRAGKGNADPRHSPTATRSPRWVHRLPGQGRACRGHPPLTIETRVSTPRETLESHVLWTNYSSGPL